MPDRKPDRKPDQQGQRLAKARVGSVNLTGDSFDPPLELTSRIQGPYNSFTNPAVIQAFAGYFSRQDESKLPFVNGIPNWVTFSLIPEGGISYEVGDFRLYGPAFLGALDVAREEQCRQVRQWVHQHGRDVSLIHRVGALKGDRGGDAAWEAIGRSAVRVTDKRHIDRLLGAFASLDRRAFPYEPELHTLWYHLTTSRGEVKVVRLRIPLVPTAAQALVVKAPPVPLPLWRWIYALE